MSERKVPSPAEIAARARAEREREQERERVKTVRKRRRLVRGSHITSHIDEEAARALTKIAYPDLEGRRDHDG